MSFTSSRVWALQQVFRGIKNAKGVFFLALMLASLSLTIPVFVASVLYSLSEPIRAIPVAPEITVFTYQNLSKAQLDNLRERIGRHEHVMKITTIPKDEAFKSLNENLGIKQNQDNASNPLPDLIIVTLDTHMPAADIERTAKNIEKLKGVSLVAYDSTWLTKLDAISHAITNLGWIFVAITLSLIVCVIAASVRLAADTQKTELNMLYLFGATPSFSIRPYAWRGFLTMGLAAVIAIGLSSFATGFLNEALLTVGEQYGTSIAITPLPWEFNAGFIAFCALLGSLIASIITQRAIAKIERFA
ncbi:cell division protein FtsX [Parasutterella secunda]|uniref:Cell division protein FtsX n=1 Tax=Parasutterella secunda TaxID=626947 RepID=A0ABS2GSI6_9BURK|nr:permease-like cell division protein FtsX [Parasutterella secunda]MBM6927822.1 hypothetical protein [Parasutterella secunda]